MAALPAQESCGTSDKVICPSTVAMPTRKSLLSELNEMDLILKNELGKGMRK